MNFKDVYCMDKLYYHSKYVIVLSLVQVSNYRVRRLRHAQSFGFEAILSIGTQALTTPKLL
jgi:hypothetical protein